MMAPIQCKAVQKSSNKIQCYVVIKILILDSVLRFVTVCVLICLKAMPYPCVCVCMCISYISSEMSLFDLTV